METSAAAEALGLTPVQLMKLRAELLKPGIHWHCKNPTVSPMGRRYIFNVAKIQPLLIPDEPTDPPNDPRS